VTFGTSLVIIECDVEENLVIKTEEIREKWRRLHHNGLRKL
jgi:hypothetical protein